MEKILYQNEKQANKIAARVMLCTWGLYTLVYLLNIIGIFIIDKTVMNIAYVVGSVALILPWLIVKFGKHDWRWLKYFIVFCATIFIALLCVALTYHSVVVYVYPIGIASLYFQRRLNVIATALSVITTGIGQILAFYYNPLPDLNFPTYEELILFSVFPRTLSLIAMAVIFTMLSERTAKMLKQLTGAVEEISEYQQEMIIGFSTLMEKRDDSTGGHIQRTSKYVGLIAQGLAERGHYLDVLTPEYVKVLIQVASMHDIGKIAVPDYILQKKDKLTDEEYEIMKKHAAEGGKIIKDTFGHLNNKEQNELAYMVANFHHEKWNGTGYPNGLKGEEIPLAARIMAVADVFDAVSEKRCYREALPMDECFRIIEKGRGTSFEPLIVDVFLESREAVEKVHQNISELTKQQQS